MENFTLITGASGGIGRAIALRLAEQGRNLVLTADKNTDGLAESCRLVKKTYREFFGAACKYMDCRYFLSDVSNEECVSRLFDKLEEEHIHIDALINNAGISCFELIQDMSADTWHSVLGVNLDGPFYMCRKALPAMIQAKSGVIINISSYWGIAGSAMESAYCASKGGLNAFTLSLAKELKESGIRANAIACEFVNTRMNEHLSGEETEEALKLMPSGRIIEPAEIAEAAAALIAPECRITGKILSMEDCRHICSSAN